MSEKIKEFTLSLLPEGDNLFIGQLDTVVDASVDTIHLENCLDGVAYNKREEVLRRALSKLRYGGSIDLTGLDLLDFGIAIYKTQLGINEINYVIYGDSLEFPRISSDTAMHMIQLLEQEHGLTIEAKIIDKYHYYVKGVRNGN